MITNHYCQTRDGAKHICSLCREERDALKAERAHLLKVVDAARRVRGAWLRNGAATEDMKAACSLVDMALAALDKREGG